MEDQASAFDIHWNQLLSRVLNGGLSSYFLWVIILSLRVPHPPTFKYVYLARGNFHLFSTSLPPPLLPHFHVSWNLEDLIVPQRFSHLQEGEAHCPVPPPPPEKMLFHNLSDTHLTWSNRWIKKGEGEQRGVRWRRSNTCINLFQMLLTKTSEFFWVFQRWLHQGSRSLPRLFFCSLCRYMYKKYNIQKKSLYHGGVVLINLP